jgi:hypothetical protein
MNEVAHSSAKIFLNTKGTYTQNGIYNTDLTFAVRPFILHNSDPSHFIVGVEQASIPLSISMVNETNNKISINGTIYSIPTGNYTTTTLLTALNLFNVAFVFGYNADKNRLFITTASPYTINSTTTAQKILGVVAGVGYASEALFTNVLNLTSTSGIIVQIDNLYTENRDNTSGGVTTVCRIPITAPVNKIQQYFNPTPFYSTISNRDISIFRIKLLGDDYTQLVLDGNPDWFIVLRIDFADKRTYIPEPTQIQQFRKDLQVQDLRNTAV